MPAAAIIKSSDDKGIREEDIWHIVNYVLSIVEPEVVAPNEVTVGK